MRELSFSINAAVRYGVDGAILLQGMAVWISKNRANQRHFHDGRWWTYNSKAALAKLFPFWSAKQLRRIVKSLSEEGALLLGNYSDGILHNTTWYALSDDVLELLGAEDCASIPIAAAENGGQLSDNPVDRSPREDPQKGTGEAPGSTCPNGQIPETTSPFGQVDLPKRAEDKQVNTNNNPPESPPSGATLVQAELADIFGDWYAGKAAPLDDHVEALRLYSEIRTRASCAAVEEQLRKWLEALGPGALPLRDVLRGDTWRDDPYFWLFWKIYPRKIDKERARRAWKKLNPGRALALTLLQSLRAWKLCDQWQEEQYIPHPTTWLNGRRWEATPPAGRSTEEGRPTRREVEEWN